MLRGAGVALAALVVLACAGPTAAATPKICNATPQEIYQDLADNGRLDRHYCASEINRALQSPSLKPYELRTRGGSTPSRTIVPAATDTHGSLPFSGLDLALFLAVGGPLLLLGASIGRVTRVRTEPELGQ